MCSRTDSRSSRAGWLATVAVLLGCAARQPPPTSILVLSPAAPEPTAIYVAAIHLAEYMTFGRVGGPHLLLGDHSLSAGVLRALLGSGTVEGLCRGPADDICANGARGFTLTFGALEMLSSDTAVLPVQVHWMHAITDEVWLNPRAGGGWQQYVLARTGQAWAVVNVQQLPGR